MVETAVQSESECPDILDVLFEWRADEIKITRRIVEKIAGNLFRGAAFMKIILRHRPFQANIDDYGDMLQIASKKGNRDLVSLLIAHGADVNAEGAYGNALQAASARGDQEMVKMLLDHGEETNIEGGFWGYALQAAAYEGNLHIVDMLLDHGADIDAQGHARFTALHEAVWTENAQLTAVLISKSCKVHLQDNSGRTPLHYAVRKGHKELVEKLLLSATSSSIDHRGYTPLMYARNAGRHDLVRLLLPFQLPDDAEFIDSFGKGILDWELELGTPGDRLDDDLEGPQFLPVWLFGET